MSFCTPIFALQVSVSNETIESKILQSSTTPEGVWTQPMPTVGWTIIAPVPPLLKFTFGVWTYINNYQKYYFLLIWYDSCMVRYTPFIVLFKISGFCAILDFGFDFIDRKSSKFTKEQYVNGVTVELSAESLVWNVQSRIRLPSAILNVAYQFQ